MPKRRDAASAKPKALSRSASATPTASHRMPHAARYLKLNQDTGVHTLAHEVSSTTPVELKLQVDYFRSILFTVPVEHDRA